MALFLFDIDGTLIGGDGCGRRAFDRACAEVMGFAGALDHLRLDGMTDPAILADVFRHHARREPTAEEARAVFGVYVEHLEREVASGNFHVKPAVPEALDLLERRGASVGLATGNIEAGARVKLARGGLWRRFAFGGFGSDSADRAELVRVAIARAGRRFDEVHVIGDTPRDVAAAHAAGARAVGIATGRFGVEELRACGADEVHPTMKEWIAGL